MTKSSTYVGPAIGIIALSIAAGAGMAIASTPDAPTVEDVERSASSVDREGPPVDQLLAVLRVEPSKEDALSEWIDPAELGINGVDPLSSRILGTTDTAKFWVALEINGQPCLVTEITRDEVAASTCGSTATLASKGIGLQVFGPYSATEAYLLPDGATPKGDGVKRLGENLLVVDPLGERPEVSDFDLHLLPALSEADLAPTFGK